ncbi:MAG: phytoene desaturase family protein, partial [Thermodesulfobacteriota bacterium]
MKDFDVIVIGSGIGGLICAGLLVSKGVKVLILEKNPTPGGYLSSFSRRGFVFDSAVDCFSGLDEKGVIRYVLKALDVEDEIGFVRVDPIRESIFPDMRVIVDGD